MRHLIKSLWTHRNWIIFPAIVVGTVVALNILRVSSEPATINLITVPTSVPTSVPTPTRTVVVTVTPTVDVYSTVTSTTTITVHPTTTHYVRPTVTTTITR